MANGSTTRGPAKRDMILDAGSKHDRYLQRMIDEEREQGRLPSYSDEGDSEITANRQGLHVKSALPRTARMVIGICVGVGLGALLIAAAVVAVLKVWPR